MSKLHGPRLARIQQWKQDRIIQLYFHEGLLRSVIARRLNVPWDTVDRHVKRHMQQPVKGENNGSKVLQIPT